MFQRIHFRNGEKSGAHDSVAAARAAYTEDGFAGRLLRRGMPYGKAEDAPAYPAVVAKQSHGKGRIGIGIGLSEIVTAAGSNDSAVSAHDHFMYGRRRSGF